jgi:Cytochrome P450
MSLYPDVQKKAQEEIDAVVGHDRLPTFEDRERLPYVDVSVGGLDTMFDAMLIVVC